MNSRHQQMAVAVEDSLAPRSVLVLGTRVSQLVEALRARGISTQGRDLPRSLLARDPLPEIHPGGPRVAPEPIDGQFDLAICVLDPLVPPASAAVIESLVEASRRVLVSVPSPEATGVLEWMRMLAAVGFAPSLTYDATFLSASAFLVEVEDGPIRDDVVRAASELVSLRAERLHSEDVWTIQRALSQERDTTRALQAELISVRRHLDDAEGLESRLHSSDEGTPWGRPTAVIRKLAARLPPTLRRPLLATAKRAGKIRSLLRGVLLRRTAHEEPAGVPGDRSGIEGGSDSWTAGGRSTQETPVFEPLRVFPSPSGRRVVNVVADSTSLGSLLGGTRTAILLGALLAGRLARPLRVVTRARSDAGEVANVLRSCGLDLPIAIEMITAGGSRGRALPTCADDYFIATSWSAAAAASGFAASRRLIYMLHEDERDVSTSVRLRTLSSEVLMDPRLRILIDSRDLMRHLADGPTRVPALEQRSTCFDPPIPSLGVVPAVSREGSSGQRNLVVYCHPGIGGELCDEIRHLVRALVEERVVAPNLWKVVILASRRETANAGTGPECLVIEDSCWDRYARLVAQADVGLVVLSSPHASFPMLDLLSGGAEVIVASCNPSGFNPRGDLQRLAHVPHDVPLIRQRVVEAARRAESARARSRPLAGEPGDGWRTILSPVVASIAES